MALATYYDKDGNLIEINLPDYALEATQSRMLDAVKSLVGANQDAVKKYEKLLDAQKKYADDSAALEKEQLEILKEMRDDDSKSNKNNNKTKPDGGLTDLLPELAGSTNKLRTVMLAAASVVGGVFISSIGATAKAMLNIGSTMQDLTQVGVGFEKTSGETASVIASMNALGLSTAQASGLLSNLSGATQVLGKKGISDLTSSFAAASKYGSEFGLSLADSIGALESDIEMRKTLGLLQGLDTSRAAKQSATLFKQQLQATQLLGVAIDDIREAASGTVEDNINFSLRLNQISQQLGDVNLASDFTTSVQRALGDLRSIGVEQSLIDQIGNEAFDVIAFASDSGRELFKALQVVDSKANTNITGALQEINQMVAAGDVKGAEAGLLALDDKIRNIASNLGAEDLKFLQLQLRNLGSTGESVARSLLQVQQANKEATGRFNDLAKGAAAFDQATNQLSTGFSTILADISSIFAEPLGILVDDLAKEGGAFSALRSAIEGVSGAISGDLSKTATNFIQSLTAINEVTGKTGAQELVDDLVETIGTIGDIAKVVWGIMDFTGTVLGSAFTTLSTIVSALTLPFTALMSGLSDASTWLGEVTGISISDWFASSEIEWKDGIAKFIGVLLGAGAAYVAGSKTVNAVRSLTGAGVEAVAGANTGPAAAGNTANNRRAGGLSRGLKSLLNPRLLVGAAALIGVAFAVDLAADAFDKFSEVSWEDIGKGVTAIAGLGVVSAVLGKFAPIVAIGALAIGAIGLALRAFPKGILSDLGNAFEGFSTIITAVFSGFSDVADAIGDSIDKIVNSAARGEALKMESQTSAIEKLSTINSDNIVVTSRAIDTLTMSLKTFGTTVGNDGWFSDTGIDVDKQEEFVKVLSLTSSLDAVKIQASAGAIGSLAQAYAKIADIDSDKLNNVSGAIRQLNREVSRDNGSLEKVITVIKNNMVTTAEKPVPPTPVKAQPQITDRTAEQTPANKAPGQTPADTQQNKSQVEILQNLQRTMQESNRLLSQISKHSKVISDNS